MTPLEIAKNWCFGCRNHDPISNDEDDSISGVVMHAGERNGGTRYQCTATERLVLLDLIKQATFSGGGGELHCPWCPYGYKQAHQWDCRAAAIMGWPTTAGAFEKAEARAEARLRMS